MVVGALLAAGPTGKPARVERAGADQAREAEALADDADATEAGRARAAARAAEARAAAQAAEARADEAAFEALETEFVYLRVTVVDVAGRPVPNATAFAVDEASGAITAERHVDGSGATDLGVPNRPHKFGAIAAGLALRGLEQPDDRSVRLVMGPQPRMNAPSSAVALDVTAAPDADPGAVQLVKATILDPRGAPLSGVLASVVNPVDASVIASDTSDAAGGVRLALRPGRYRLFLLAPSLRVAKLERKGPNVVVFRMEIAAAPESVTVRKRAPVSEDGFEDSPATMARRRFNGGQNNMLPRVSPTVADLLKMAMDTRRETDPYISAIRSGRNGSGPYLAETDAVAGMQFTVAPQPAGAFCFLSSHCSRAAGAAVCCTAAGEIADEYAEGYVGQCTLRKDCRPRPRPRR
jgi:hypothetical protein